MGAIGARRWWHHSPSESVGQEQEHSGLGQGDTFPSVYRIKGMCHSVNVRREVRQTKVRLL